MPSPSAPWHLKRLTHSLLRFGRVKQRRVCSMGCPMSDDLQITADLYAIRDFVEADRNFILATWLRSLRTAPMYRFIPNNIFYQRIEPILWRMIANHTVKVVCIAGEEDHIVGWICGTKDFLDYCYIKRHTRSCGLVARLLEALELTEEPIRCTFWTHYAERFAGKWHYKPSLIEWA